MVGLTAMQEAHICL